MDLGRNEADTVIAKDDRCQRWRKIAIDQLSYAVNLTLTFAVAALGYWFVLLQNDHFIPGASAKFFMSWSFRALVLSTIFGFACVVNRLWDFRGTARRACGHPKAPSKEALRDLGSYTWWLFYLQLALFGTGVLLLAAALLETYGGKLT